MKCPYGRCIIRGKCVLLIVCTTVCNVYFYIGTCTFMDVCCCPNRHGYTSGVYEAYYFPCVYSVWVHVRSPTRRIMSILLRFVWKITIGTCTLCSSTFTVVPTNTGKYHVSLMLKHTTVSILHCSFSVLVHERPTLSCLLASSFVSICTKFGVLSRPADFTNPMPPP